MPCHEKDGGGDGAGVGEWECQPHTVDVPEVRKNQKKWNDEQHNLVGMESDLIPGYEATTAGQKKYFKALCDELKKTKGCIGIFWWEPSAVSYEGFPSSMENQTWFDFEGNYNGTGDVYLD